MEFGEQVTGGIIIRSDDGTHEAFIPDGVGFLEKAQRTMIP